MVLTDKIREASFGSNRDEVKIRSKDGGRVEQTKRPRALYQWGHVAPRKENSVDPHERPVVTNDNKVAMRAGSTGNHVRYVLIASTALVIVALIAIALFVKP
jgi:hypothetical protein